MRKSILFALMTVFTAAPANADDLDFAGRWQQVYSSEGFCKSCIVALVQNGTVLTITANDGWSAVLQTDNPGHASFATGAGRRRQRGEPIEIGLLLKGDDLHVMMLVKARNGPAKKIKAIYRKPAEESPTRRI